MSIEAARFLFFFLICPGPFKSGSFTVDTLDILIRLSLIALRQMEITLDGWPPKIHACTSQRYFTSVAKCAYHNLALSKSPIATTTTHKA